MRQLNASPIKRSAALAAAALVLGVGGSAPRALADPSGKTPAAANAPAADKSIYREFGMVDGVEPKDPWVKDASGNYTNPDAKIAHQALGLYVEGAMTSVMLRPVHRETAYINQQTTDPNWDDLYRVADTPGVYAPLLQMFNNGDERTKAIVLAVVVSAHDQAWLAAQSVRLLDQNTFNFGAPSDKLYFTASTPDKIAAKVTEIENAASPVAADEKMTDAIWAGTDFFLERAKSSGLSVAAAVAKRVSSYPAGDPRTPLLNSILTASRENPTADPIWLAQVSFTPQ